MTTIPDHNQIKRTLTQYRLCDACLGRVFKYIEQGVTNRERGKHIRSTVKHTVKVETKDCWLCEGLLNEISHFTDIIQESLKNHEFHTFLIGSKIDEDIVKKEKETIDFSGSTGSEPIKMEMNREIGKILEQKLGKIVNFETPDITAVIDTPFDVVSLQIKSLYIYGRYKKFERGIPQTRWPCRICRGKGCRACQYTGKMYETSVEELIAKQVLEHTKGTEEAFHGSGREDIDARMLGTGRPFVLEVKNPKIRIIDLAMLNQQINTMGNGRIEVSNLRFSDADEVARIKNAEFRKIYEVVLEAEKPIDEEKLKKVALTLQGTTIQQFTPTRVAHRRANLVRERKIYSCSIDSVEGTIARLTIETESGTYVKELVSGDNGNTQPNISELLQNPCKVKDLDVIAIKGE